MLELRHQNLDAEGSAILQGFLTVRNTILRGIKELGEEEGLDKDRNRAVGGGRSSVLEKRPDIDDVFLQLLKEHTAGDPMNVQVKWTNLTCAEIASLLAKQGFKVSRNIVRQLLKKHAYVKRKAVKKVCWRACES